MLLSTNPIAIAVPALEEPPLVLDMATTVAAYGKVKVAAQQGKTMPEGWMIDREGRPLTDPRRADEGFLLPIGGYKGAALSLMFGLLAGTLNGAAMGKDVLDFNKDDTTPTNTGQAICVVDIKRFGEPIAFKRQVDAVIRQLHGSALLPGFDRIRLPGEDRAARIAERTANGIPIPGSLKNALDKMAGGVGDHEAVGVTLISLRFPAKAGTHSSMAQELGFRATNQDKDRPVRLSRSSVHLRLSASLLFLRSRPTASIHKPVDSSEKVKPGQHDLSSHASVNRVRSHPQGPAEDEPRERHH